MFLAVSLLSSTLLSRVLFTWFNEFVTKGKESSLSGEEVPNLRKDHRYHH